MGERALEREVNEARVQERVEERERRARERRRRIEEKGA